MVLLKIQIKIFIGIALTFTMLVQAPFLVAQGQITSCFPYNTVWGSTPDQVATSKGQPKNHLKNYGFTAYTYPAQFLNNQGEVSYYFTENRLS